LPLLLRRVGAMLLLLPLSRERLTQAARCSASLLLLLLPRLLLQLQLHPHIPKPRKRLTHVR
jgi:hypothetical protein